MKKVTFCAAMLLITSVTVYGQSAYFSSGESHTPEKMEKAVTRYVSCLGSPNQGVVESALAHAVWMKLCVPDREFVELQARVNSLAATSPEPVIRYKAYLASLVFDQPELFKGEAGQIFENGDELFVSLSSRLQYALLEKGERKYVRSK
jgi:hypothetical protein